MNSRDYAHLVAKAMNDKRRDDARREFIRVEDTPENLRRAQDYNREYDIAPRLYDGRGD